MNDTRSQLDIFSFLQKLDEKKIPRRLDSVRDDAIMVEIPLPGERWEIEFFATGEIDIEVFRSDGKIRHAEALHELLAR
jgi:hypothetical protein